MRRHRTPTQRITVQPLSVRARRRVALRALCFALTASLVPLALTIAASPARATQQTDDAEQTTAATSLSKRKPRWRARKWRPTR